MVRSASMRRQRSQRPTRVRVPTVASSWLGCLRSVTRDFHVLQTQVVQTVLEQGSLMLIEIPFRLFLEHAEHIDHLLCRHEVDREATFGGGIGDLTEIGQSLGAQADDKGREVDLHRRHVTVPRRILMLMMLMMLMRSGMARFLRRFLFAFA